MHISESFICLWPLRSWLYMESLKKRGLKWKRLCPGDKQPWAFLGSFRPSLVRPIFPSFIRNKVHGCSDLTCSFHHSPCHLPEWGNHSPLQRGLFVWTRLFSLCHGFRQLSSVFCLNTEWQSTNTTSKNFDLSFFKSYCNKSIPKIAKWLILCVQGILTGQPGVWDVSEKEWHRIGYSQMPWESGVVGGSEAEERGKVKWRETALLSHLFW